MQVLLYKMLCMRLSCSAFACVSFAHPPGVSRLEKEAATASPDLKMINRPSRAFFERLFSVPFKNICKFARRYILPNPFGSRGGGGAVFVFEQFIDVLGNSSLFVLVFSVKNGILIIRLYYGRCELNKVRM